MSRDITSTQQRVEAMLWYVAVIAVVNLALGYALAVLLGSGRGRSTMLSGDAAKAGEPAEF